MTTISPQPKVRLLIVDDDPLILRQISLILKSDDFVLDTAENGELALNKINGDGNYDAIVLDIMMPGKTGLEVCEEVRKQFNLFELPIVISSALSSPEDIAKGLECGANDYISKPINRIELIARVKNLVNLKQINDIARANENLAKTQTYYDSVTGLPNRSYLYSKIQSLVEKVHTDQSSVAVIVFNIDNFKSINNSLGYHIGDIYLQEISRLIKSNLEKDDLLIHLHTDTFAVLKSGFITTSDRQSVVEDYVRSLLKNITQPITIHQYEFSMTASAGIAFYPFENRSLNEVLRCADAAMYVSKRRTQNSFLFHSKVIHNTETARFDLEKKLKHAINQNQFAIYYQPQISTSSEKIVGAEALVRWEHPTEGLIFPGNFIPVAEESGLIINLSEWIIEEAVKQSLHWQGQGLEPIRIGINLSPQHFHSKNLIPYIKSILENYHFSAENLEFEITEGCIMTDIDEAIDQLNEMREMGLGLSVDDFGTGYSSLSYLKRFPIHTLKIDQSFISPNISQNITEGAIVQSIIKLGHSLNLNVIAEGVETFDQLEYLRRNYCNEVQGFYFSRAISVSTFPDLVRSFS